MGTTATTKDVLVNKDLHRRAKAQAASEGRSLKSLMEELLAGYLAEKAEPGIEAKS